MTRIRLLIERDGSWWQVTALDDVGQVVRVRSADREQATGTARIKARMELGLDRTEVEFDEVSLVGAETEADNEEG